ncbi:GDSL esterase/lipase At5g45910-like [Oryza brachyantha]|uniref:GDSL esterase/lipase At5g45910-like n=1 Tax=Oryza brachyantha TaxID=4533 RepID=UPI001ADBA203|nr:GDSL esterase/lipase At5g45910-like [Oryza brachyantha]
MAAEAAVVLFVAVFLLSVACRPGSSQSYNAIYNFGDSITDTGNLCTGGCPSWLTTGQPPYGNTYFGRPTGRCTDGRVIVDFLADRFGLPLLPPSKASGGDFKRGANMAIIGATTMNFDFFQSIGLGNSIWNNGPLDTQIQWFQQLMPSICGNDCKSYLGNSLFIFGEFGGNDYNAPLFGGKSMDEVKGYVPQIISKITSGVETLIGLGAVDIVVPGVLPIGCFPLYLTLYQSSSQDDYDGNGCLKSFNSLAVYHNGLLKQGLAGVQSKYPAVRLMYGDFYDQVAQMVQSPGSFGLTYGLKVCCGAGGQGSYNYNNQARCGMSGASACGDPENYLVWDGIHLTEAAYRSIADGWLRGPYCSPAILH